MRSDLAYIISYFESRIDPDPQTNWARGYNACLSDAALWLRELKLDPPWIKTGTEPEPPSNRDLLVTYAESEDEKASVELDRFAKGHFTFEKYGYVPTAWMLAPEPYQEDR